MSATITILKAITAILVGVVITLAVMLAVQNDNAIVNAAAVSVSEDSPAFNCFTMGNETCNVDTYVIADNGGEEIKGAVMEAANDGIVYVAWEDGIVTPAAEWQREAAWNTCVDYADGSDASLFECDAAFQNEGDRFTK